MASLPGEENNQDVNTAGWRQYPLPLRDRVKRREKLSHRIRQKATDLEVYPGGSG